MEESKFLEAEKQVNTLLKDLTEILEEVKGYHQAKENLDSARNTLENSNQSIGDGFSKIQSFLGSQIKIVEEIKKNMEKVSEIDVGSFAKKLDSFLISFNKESLILSDYVKESLSDFNEKILSLEKTTEIKLVNTDTSLKNMQDQIEKVQTIFNKIEEAVKDGAKSGQSILDRAEKEFKEMKSNLNSYSDNLDVKVSKYSSDILTNINSSSSTVKESFSNLDKKVDKFERLGEKLEESNNIVSGKISDSIVQFSNGNNQLQRDFLNSSENIKKDMQILTTELNSKVETTKTTIYISTGVIIFSQLILFLAIKFLG